MASHTHTQRKLTQIHKKGNTHTLTHTQTDCKLFSAWLCLGSEQDASRMTKHSLTDTCGRPLDVDVDVDVAVAVPAVVDVSLGLLSRRSDGSTRNELMMGQGKFQFASVRNRVETKQIPCYPKSYE